MLFKHPSLTGLFHARKAVGLGLLVKDTPRQAGTAVLGSWLFEAKISAQYALSADRADFSVSGKGASLGLYGLLMADAGSMVVSVESILSTRDYVCKVTPASLVVTPAGMGTLVVNRQLQLGATQYSVALATEAALLAGRNLYPDIGTLALEGKFAKLGLLRTPFLFVPEVGSFSVQGAHSRVTLEVDMFISAALSNENMAAVAAAVLAAARLEPIKAEVPPITNTFVSEVVEAVIADPRSLTVSKFLGLK